MFYQSEFKKYFGFDEKLEDSKFRNDENLSFDTSKLNKINVFFCSVFFGFIMFSFQKINKNEKSKYLAVTKPVSKIKLMLKSDNIWRSDGSNTLEIIKILYD